MSELCIEQMDESDNNYKVERILKKRYIKKSRKTEFLVRWLGYTEDADSWEPRENILDKNLIDIFNKRKTKEPATLIKKETKSDSKVEPQISQFSLKRKYMRDPDPKVSGFKRGLVAEAILGSTGNNGEKREFLICWTDKSECIEFVDVKEANLNCPQLVIDYYENHLVFVNETDAKSLLNVQNITMH